MAARVLCACWRCLLLLVTLGREANATTEPRKAVGEQALRGGAAPPRRLPSCTFPGEGWHTVIGGGCYWVSQELASFVDCQGRVCASWGGSLATVGSAEAARDLMELVPANGHYLQKSAWIGLYRQEQGVWRWVDGTLNPFRNWDDLRYQPDDAGFHPETCAYMTHEHGSNKWHDGPCLDAGFAMRCLCHHGSHASAEYQVFHNDMLSYQQIQPCYASSPQALLTSCPSPWRPYGDQCYYVSEEKASFSGCQSKCDQMGGSLATVDEVGLSCAIMQLVPQTGEHYTDTSAWIGLYRIAPGAWQWVDGSSAGFTYWDASSPSVSSGFMETCAFVSHHHSSEGRWHDGGCSETGVRMSCICKRGSAASGAYQAVAARIGGDRSNVHLPTQAPQGLPTRPTTTQVAPNVIQAFFVVQATQAMAVGNVPIASMLLTISNIDYSRLMTNFEVLSDVYDAVRGAFAARLHGRTTQEMIVLEFFPGSVDVRANFYRASSGSLTVQEVRAACEQNDALKTSLLQDVRAVPGIGAVSTGTLVVHLVGPVQVLTVDDVLDRVGTSTTAGARSADPLVLHSRIRLRVGSEADASLLQRPASTEAFTAAMRSVLVLGSDDSFELRSAAMDFNSAAAGAPELHMQVTVRATVESQAEAIAGRIRSPDLGAFTEAFAQELRSRGQDLSVQVVGVEALDRIDTGPEATTSRQAQSTSPAAGDAAEAPQAETESSTASWLLPVLICAVVLILCALACVAYIANLWLARAVVPAHEASVGNNDKKAAADPPANDILVGFAYDKPTMARSKSLNSISTASGLPHSKTQSKTSTHSGPSRSNSKTNSSATPGFSRSKSMSSAAVAWESSRSGPPPSASTPGLTRSKSLNGVSAAWGKSRSAADLSAGSAGMHAARTSSHSTAQPTTSLPPLKEPANNAITAAVQHSSSNSSNAAGRKSRPSASLAQHRPSSQS